MTALITLTSGAMAVEGDYIPASLQNRSRNSTKLRKYPEIRSVRYKEAFGISPKAYRAGGSDETITYACRTTALGLMIMAATYGVRHFK